MAAAPAREPLSRADEQQTSSIRFDYPPPYPKQPTSADDNGSLSTRLTFQIKLRRCRWCRTSHRSPCSDKPVPNSASGDAPRVRYSSSEHGFGACCDGNTAASPPSLSTYAPVRAARNPNHVHSRLDFPQAEFRRPYRRGDYDGSIPNHAASPLKLSDGVAPRAGSRGPSSG
jgi:hypothetical protein